MKTTETLHNSNLSNINDTGENVLPANLLCLSHLRWDFVYQRPQHLLSRFSKVTNVYFVEEPIFDADHNYNAITRKDNITVVVPHIAPGSDPVNTQRELLDDLIASERIIDFALWYYTPMALTFSKHLEPVVTIFDCMDELSAFRFAPAELKQLEAELLLKADVVFTGGYSLYNAKKSRHSNIHPLPSSVDKEHFGRARSIAGTPVDQSRIPAPRIGFFGVIDERFDTALIDGIARQQPDWHIILIGPVVKIDPAILPQRDNIHYLGSKSYGELPDYIAGWDIAMIPFLLNESTAFISPTKTPEYLSAGVPVISTPIRDVVHPYGENKLVQIVASVEEFIDAANNIFLKKMADGEWLQKVDDFLSNDSWDATVEKMMLNIHEAVQKKIVNV